MTTDLAKYTLLLSIFTSMTKIFAKSFNTDRTIPHLILFISNKTNKSCTAQLRSYLFSQLCEWFSPSQISEPIIDGALWPCSDEPEIILLVDLRLPFSRVWKCIIPQLFCNDAAEVWADLKSSEGIIGMAKQFVQKAIKSVMSSLPLKG